MEKDNLQSNIANQNKRRTEEEEKRKIFNENNSIKNTNDSKKCKNIMTGLTKWIELKSWSSCEKCQSLCRQKMLPSAKKPTLKQCYACSGRYPLLRIEDFPTLVLTCTQDDANLLRVFHVDLGEYIKHRYGYRQRSSPLSLEVRPTTVLHRINEIEDVRRKRRLHRVYCYLMDSEESMYRQ